MINISRYLARHLAIGFVAITLPMLGGCTQDMSDLEAFVAQTMKKPAKPIPPVPQMEPYVPFIYSAFDMRDPFSVPDYVEEEVKDNGIRPDSNRPKEPLEAFPLDGMDMMGVIERAGNHPLALIIAPDGAIHTLDVGNYLGQNFGRITNIQEDRIDLIEIIPDGDGGWMERPATVAMKDSGTQGKKP